jgi:O-antigen ligase
MDKAAYLLFLCVIIISPLLFGTVHTYAYSFVFLLILTANSLLLFPTVAKDPVCKVRFFRWPITAFNPIFFVLLAYLFIQIIPLPEALVAFFSPQTEIIAGKSIPASLVINNSSHSAYIPITPYTYPVQMSLLRWFIYGIFFLGFSRTLSTRIRIETATGCILATACFSCLYGIFQTYSGSDQIWWFTKVSYLEDVTGTFINRNHFASFMGMALMLAVSYSFSFKGIGFNEKNNFRKRVSNFLVNQQFYGKKLLALSSGVVIGFGLILSASKAGIISATAGLFFISGFFLLKKNQRRNGLITLAVFFCIMLLALFIGAEHTWYRFDGFGTSFDVRKRYTETTLQLFLNFITFGVGVGNFRYAFPKYQNALDGYSFIEYAHNDWIQFLAEAGIVGFILFLAGITYYLYRNTSLLKKAKSPYHVALGIMPLAAIVMISIHSYSDFNLHIPANFLILSAIVAIGYSSLTLQDNSEETSSVQYYCLPLKGKGLFFLSLYALLILSAGWLSIRHFMAETHCNTVHNSTFNRNQYPSENEILKAISWQDSNAEYWYKLARHKIKYRQPEFIPKESSDIIKTLEQAIRLNPLEVEYHIKLGWEYLDQSEYLDNTSKSLANADLSMERAAFFIGKRNPWQHKELGDYWLIRSTSYPDSSAQREKALTKAQSHYKNALLIHREYGKEKLYKDITNTIVKYYPAPKNHILLNLSLNHAENK